MTLNFPSKNFFRSNKTKIHHAQIHETFTDLFCLLAIFSLIVSTVKINELNCDLFSLNLAAQYFNSFDSKNGEKLFAWKTYPVFLKLCLESENIFD